MQTVCVLIGLDWAEPMMQFFCMSHVQASPMNTCSLFNILVIFELLGIFLIVFLSFPLFLFTLVVSMAPKRKFTPARNPHRSKASSSSDPALLSLRFRDDDAHKAFSENFSRRGVHSERQVILVDFTDTNLPTIIHNREWESLCDVSVTCPLVLIQEFYSNMHGIDRSVPLLFTCVRGTRIPVTPQLVADVLWVPKIEFPNYPSCECLRTICKDELKVAFYERPSDWGDRQFTPCRPFAKGPRFINMVMTFVLDPLSYYNSITEPPARFLLSLLEHLTIDFPSHFILSIIDVYLDLASRDKLVFPSAITRILHYFFVHFPSSDHFFVMCAILRYH